jgi:hypothetical protein
MDTYKKPADELREALAKAGYTRRQVSVRHSHYSLGSSLYVTIRDASIDKARIKTIAQAFEEVRYDEYSGEILGGGNTYLNVFYTKEAADSRAAAYTEPVKAAILELDETDRSRLVKVGNTGYWIGFDSNDAAGFSLWKDNSFVRNCHQLENIAYVMAGC